MGRKSTREDKTAYQEKREELNLSREKAAALLETISEDRIYRIETGVSTPHPDEVLIMSERYKDPTLCSYYCAKQCLIGQRHSIEVELKDLPTIVLETIASLNAIDKHKDRFIEIAADCKIDEDEIEDLHDIQSALAKIAMAVEALRLWTEQMELEKEQPRTSQS